jgi:hypothetical protein
MNAVNNITLRVFTLKAKPIRILSSLRGRSPKQSGNYRTFPNCFLLRSSQFAMTGLDFIDTQAKSIGKMIFPLGRKAKTIGKMIFPSGRKAKTIGKMIFPSGKKAKTIGKMIFPLGKKAKTIGKMIFPLGRKAKPIRILSSLRGRSPKQSSNYRTFPDCFLLRSSQFSRWRGRAAPAANTTMLWHGLQARTSGSGIWGNLISDFIILVLIFNK